MSADITLRKGLTIPMSGMADLNISSADSADNFVIYPHDFHGVVPKMLLKEGEAVFTRTADFLFKSQP
jgi:Na+-transporting NADH:ubiquinone oxidoreductase subunit A